MIWLMFFLAASLGAVAILAVALAYRIQIRSMRISCERLGIPAITMESKPEPEKEPVAKKPKKKLFSVPIPGAIRSLTDRKQ
jgi:hypothetical protein